MAENDAQLLELKPVSSDPVPASVNANRTLQAEHPGTRIKVLPSRAELIGKGAQFREEPVTIKDLTPAELASAKMGNNPHLKIAGEPKAK